MNSKFCKRLRRFAQGRTVGQPYRSYVGVTTLDSMQRPVGRALVNHPETTRGFYRALKAAVRRERAV